MSKLLITLGIGLAIALIDIVPMILRKADPYQIGTAFTHWVVVAVLISYSAMPMPGWARGIVIAVLTTVPFLITLSRDHPASLLPVLGMSLLLGAVAGYTIERWAH
jgi:ribose/xylose/arabinose/galactoside ABC-type transport system permease subunit